MFFHYRQIDRQIPDLMHRRRHPTSGRRLREVLNRNRERYDSNHEERQSTEDAERTLAFLRRETMRSTPTNCLLPHMLLPFRTEQFCTANTSPRNVAFNQGTRAGPSKTNSVRRRRRVCGSEAQIFTVSLSGANVDLLSTPIQSPAR